MRKRSLVALICAFFITSVISFRAGVFYDSRMKDPVIEDYQNRNSFSARTVRLYEDRVSIYDTTVGLMVPLIEAVQKNDMATVQKLSDKVQEQTVLLKANNESLTKLRAEMGLNE